MFKIYGLTARSIQHNLRPRPTCQAIVDEYMDEVMTPPSTPKPSVRRPSYIFSLVAA